MYSPDATQPGKAADAARSGTAGPSFEPQGCALVLGNPWVLGLGLSWMVGYVALTINSLTYKAAWEVAVDAVSVPLVIYGAHVISLLWRPRVKPVSVRAGTRGLTLGERFLPRTAIRTGIILPGEPAQVRLHLRGARLPVQLRMGTARDASALLEILGLDDAHTVAVFDLAPGVRAPRLGLLAVALLLVVPFLMWKLKSSALQWPGMMLSGWVLRLGSMPTQLGVGADGVTLRWLWQRRFLGFDTITSVDRHDAVPGKGSAGLRIAQEPGGETFLSFPDGAKLSRAEARIREAMDAFREGGGSGTGGPFRAATGRARSTLFLRRGGRSLVEWAAALRALGAAAGTAGGPRARLLRIVEDPAAEGVDRVAAAVALGGDHDEESRARLHAAVNTVAAPKLRVALERAVASESEAESEAVLAELDGNEARVQRVS